MAIKPARTIASSKPDDRTDCEAGGPQLPQRADVKAGRSSLSFGEALHHAIPGDVAHERVNGRIDYVRRAIGDGLQTPLEARAGSSGYFHTQSSASSAMWMTKPKAISRVTRGTSRTAYAAIAGYVWSG